jgi:biopolymer transport protein ExbB
MKYKNRIILFSLITIISISFLNPSLNIFNQVQLHAQDNITAAEQPALSNDENRGTPGDSLYLTFKQGGLLMWPILLLGIIGCTIIIERLIYFYRNRIWNKETLEEYINKTVNTSNAKFREELENEIQDAVQIYANQAERALALLNAIGNLAPIIGFFGTVQGMIGAFASIAAATTVNAKVVAVGIQIALITTAGGLSVAVPVLAFFYFFAHLIQTMFAKLDIITIEKVKHLPRYSDYEASKSH